ncbi:Protein of unknown function [Desulfonatronum zhilinae]|nr:Protein of unknown function [Desulfonatronum zhilinae]
MSKFLILIGVFLLVTGLFRPLLRKLRLGRLPGDFLIQRGNFRLYLPVTSSILVGLGLTVLIWLFRH